MTFRRQRIAALGLAGFAMMALPGKALAAHQEGMPHMPVLQASKSYTIHAADRIHELQDQEGFGDQAPLVRMMNRMMVEGSRRSAPRASQRHEAQGYAIQAAITPSPPRADSPNRLLLTVRDRDGKPATGLRLQAKVYMRSMDMGTTFPSVREIAPGQYQLDVVFAMSGPWAVAIALPGGSTDVLKFDVQ
ncbi:MAG: FixH family protein [Cyanobacteria bacterium REEB65]|nr:FixH family protein [Cyanobacteria bacterium REEB65]